MIMPALPEGKKAPLAERAYLRNLLPRQQTPRSSLQRTLLSNVYFIILSERGEKEKETKIQLFPGNRLPLDVPKRGKRYPVTEKQAGRSNRDLFKRVTERLETVFFC
jgi:hypothetical protein